MPLRGRSGVRGYADGKISACYLVYGLVYTLPSVIPYYNKLGLTLNLCMLHMSKAFGKVNNCGIFIKINES